MMMSEVYNVHACLQTSIWYFASHFYKAPPPLKPAQISGSMLVVEIEPIIDVYIRDRVKLMSSLLCFLRFGYCVFWREKNSGQFDITDIHL